MPANNTSALPHLLTIDQLAQQIYNCSVRQVYALAKQPGFPKAVSLGPRQRRYVRPEHEAFVLTLARANDHEPEALKAARHAKASGKPVAHAPFNGALA